MNRTALLSIDVRASFLHREYQQQPENRDFEQKLLDLISACQTRKIPLVDIFHVEEEGAFSQASGLVTRLPFLTHQADLTVYKHVHNAFTDTGLDRWLRGRDIHHLLIAGLRTEQCCETTARVASDLGYQVSFISEATLTMPLCYGDITLSVAELRQRTEAVLAGRFATIETVDSLFKH